MKRFPSLLLLDLLLLFGLLSLSLRTASPLMAQVRLGPQGPYSVEQKKKEPKKKRGVPLRKQQSPPGRQKEESLRLTLSPADVPDLPLEIRLLPRPADRKEGNSVPFYYRAMFSLREVFDQKGRDETFYRDFWPNTSDQWSEAPLEQLPRQKMHRFLDSFGNVFDQLQIATHREKTDWSWRLQDLNGLEAIRFLLPEMQNARDLARLLRLKIRLEIAEGRYDDAIHSLQMGFQLARDIAKPPTLINDLVGLAIASLMVESVEELMSRPDAPNLYWALSALPRPFLDIRPALEYEMQLPAKVFPALKEAETADHSPAEWGRILRRGFEGLLDAEGGDLFGNNEAVRSLFPVGLALMGYPRAKRELKEWGYDARRIEAMPVGQVIALHQSRLYQKISQEMLKWTHLPYHQSLPGIRQTEERLKREGYLRPAFQGGREIIPLMSLLMPAVFQAQRAFARTDTTIAALRAAEALRIYAARHGGRLPEKLSDIRAVPVPHNPLTGKAFGYRLQNDTAVLEVAPADADDFPPKWRRIVITIRQEKPEKPQ